MVILSDIKSKLKEELVLAKSIWIATAMISNSGWSFVQENLSPDVTQFFLIGIDLATEPKVFEAILDKPIINARIFETKYTFHPKVYLIQRKDNLYVAFVGSS